jgi:hypothetical protein
VIAAESRAETRVLAWWRSAGEDRGRAIETACRATAAEGEGGLAMPGTAFGRRMICRRSREPAGLLLTSLAQQASRPLSFGVGSAGTCP